MTTSDELLNGIRENELASAMVELTNSIRSLRSDTAASQAAGVRFDAKLLTSIAKMADMAAGWKGGLGRIGDAETVVARCQQLVDDLTARVAAVTESSAGFDARAKERVDIAYKALAKRIDTVATQLAEFPRGGYKGDPGSPGSPGKPGKAGPPGPGLPKGGSEGQIPVKASDNDYDIVWRAPDNAGGGERGAFTIWNAPASSSSAAAANGLPVGGNSGQVLAKNSGTDYDTHWIDSSGSGTVTTISVVTANGVSGSVANATTTPAITLTLGAITPTTIVASGAVSGSNLSGTNTGDQTITLTGDVTGSGTSSFAATIGAGAVTLAKMANMATASLIYRKTAGSGAPEVNTLATLKTDLGLTGTNSGDQTITLTGDVTGSGTGSFAASVAKIAGVTVSGTTGTVNAVFSNSPTLVNPALGTPASGVLTNCTNLPVAGGGTGQATLTIHGVLIGNGTGGIKDSGAGTSGQLLTSQGAADPLYADNIATLSFIVDGGGSVITTGMKGYLEIPFACTIKRVTALADQSGSVVVDIFKCTYAQFDAGSTHPVSGDKITASAPPTITTAIKSQDSTLTGWTTAIAAGDVLGFNVNSITTCQRVTISLKVTKS